MGKLEGRVAIVTGGAQGIGKAIVDKLAEEGATVVVADIDGAKGELAAAAVGGQAIRTDISSARFSPRRCCMAARQARCSSATPPSYLRPGRHRLKWRHHEREPRRHFRIPLRIGRHRKAGSGACQHRPNSILAGTPTWPAEAQGGVFAFTRRSPPGSLEGIAVNAGGPGLTAKEHRRSPHADAYDFVSCGHPGAGVSAYRACGAFLASEEAGWVTGQMLVVDAGMVRW
jgi:NAD(P)-dependent dehydrogenase (short-subunit alcohol dehydrogenase family)